MITIVDGPQGKNDWANYNWDTNEIWFEESNTRKQLTMADIVFTHGKYVGYKLSEVTDTWYLKFIKEKNPDDYFISVMFGRRLEELK